MPDKPEFKATMNEWCSECTAATEPNKRCRECMVVSIERVANGHRIGMPSEFEPLHRPTR